MVTYASASTVREARVSMTLADVWFFLLNVCGGILKEPLSKVLQGNY